MVVPACAIALLLFCLCAANSPADAYKAEPKHLKVAFCSPVVFIEDPEMVDDDALIRSFQEHEQYYKSLGFDAAFAYFDPNDKERRKRVSEVVREKFSSALDSEYWHLNTLAKPQKVEYSHLKYHGQMYAVHQCVQEANELGFDYAFFADLDEFIVWRSFREHADIQAFIRSVEAEAEDALQCMTLGKYLASAALYTGRWTSADSTVYDFKPPSTLNGRETFSKGYFPSMEEMQIFHWPFQSPVPFCYQKPDEELCIDYYGRRKYFLNIKNTLARYGDDFKRRLIVHNCDMDESATAHLSTKHAYVREYRGFLNIPQWTIPTNEHYQNKILTTDQPVDILHDDKWDSEGQLNFAHGFIWFHKEGAFTDISRSKFSDEFLNFGHTMWENRRKREQKMPGN